MNDFWYKIKDGFRRFMNGRHGADELARATIYFAILLDLVFLFTRVYAFNLISTVLFFWTLFRILSRDGGKRYAENQKFLELTANARTEFNQWKVRRANSKEFKYFRCPQCHSMLRMPRGVGEKTVTCGKCKHQFRKKA